MTRLEEVLATEQKPAKLERVLEEYGSLQQQFADVGGFEYEANIRRIAAGLGITGLLEKRWGLLAVANGQKSA